MWRLFKYDESRRSSVRHSIPSIPSLYFTLMLEPMVASCVCSDGLYASTTAGNVYAVYYKDARISWVSRVGRPIVSTPALHDSMLIAATFSSWMDGIKDGDTVVAIDAYNGSMLWEYKGIGEVFSSPCVVNSIIVLGSLDNYVYAIDTRGSLLWMYRTEGEVWCSPAYDKKNSLIIIGSDDHHVYALDLDGRLVWRQGLKGKVRSSTPCISDEGIFIGTYAGYIYRLRREDGSILCSKYIGEPILSSPAYSDGMVFFGCSDKHVYAINSECSILWRVHTGDKVWSTPAVVEDTHTLFIASLDSRIYSIDTLTGRINWIFPTMDAVDASPSLTYDKMFIGSRDGILYAFTDTPEYIR